MKTTHINFNLKPGWWLTMAFILLTLNCIEAQSKKTKVKPASKKHQTTEAIATKVNDMTRDEKNSLSKCPIHSKQMSLSDNFLADASSSNITTENYPFAYQLNYRRYCAACTHKMDKAEKVGPNKKEVNSLGTCEIHKEPLLLNSSYNKVDYEKKPKHDMIHAKQYLFEHYCKTCTKVHKIQTVK